MHTSCNNPSGIVSPHQYIAMINVGAIVTVVSLAISHKELKSSCDTHAKLLLDEQEGGERGSNGLSVISVVLVHMFVSISEVRHYLHVRITCGCCNCNSQWSNYLLRNSPFEVANASESGTVVECKGIVTLGDELAGHKSSGRKLVLCPSPQLPLTACAGHM